MGTFTILFFFFVVIFRIAQNIAAWKINNPGEPIFQVCDSSEIYSLRRSNRFANGFTSSSDSLFSDNLFNNHTNNGISDDLFNSPTNDGFSNGFIDHIHGGIDTTFNGGMAGDHNP